MNREEADARMRCCPMCDLEIKSKIYEELKDNFDLYGMSIDELCETIEKSIIAITNKLPTLLDELPTLLDGEELYRPPVEVKRDIKHEKNPMRLKQLNQELNQSYKAYRKRGK